jgi:hypothetical protein
MLKVKQTDTQIDMGDRQTEKQTKNIQKDTRQMVTNTNNHKYSIVLHKQTHSK